MNKIKTWLTANFTAINWFMIVFLAFVGIIEAIHGHLLSSALFLVISIVNLIFQLKSE